MDRQNDRPFATVSRKLQLDCDYLHSVRHPVSCVVHVDQASREARLEVR